MSDEQTWESMKPVGREFGAEPEPENFMYGDIATPDFNDRHEVEAAIIVNEVNIVNVLAEVFNMVSKQKHDINRLQSNIDDLNVLNTRLKAQVDGLQKENATFKLGHLPGVIYKYPTADGFRQWTGHSFRYPSIQECHQNGPTFSDINQLHKSK